RPALGLALSELGICARSQLTMDPGRGCPNRFGELGVALIHMPRQRRLRLGDFEVAGAACTGIVVHRALPLAADPLLGLVGELLHALLGLAGGLVYLALALQLLVVGQVTGRLLGAALQLLWVLGHGQRLLSAKMDVVRICGVGGGCSPGSGPGYGSGGCSGSRGTDGGLSGRSGCRGGCGAGAGAGGPGLISSSGDEESRI